MRELGAISTPCEFCSGHGLTTYASLGLVEVCLRGTQVYSMRWNNVL